MKKGMMLWLVGRWKGDKPWELMGLFDSRQKAVDSCTRDNDFIMDDIELNKHLGDEITPDGYYPKLGHVCAGDNPEVVKAREALQV